MNKNAFGLLVSTLFLSMLILVNGSQAAPYYEGKRLTLIVGTNPGGGYDNAARLVAKHLSEYIPGKPTVIIENMPGAGHVVAANHLYTIAKPDGLTIATLNRGLVFAQLTATEGIRFDLKKFAWIGSIAVDPTVFFIRADLPHKTIDDLRKAKDLAGSCEGLGTTGCQFYILLNEFLGLNLKIVVYPSGADSRLAIVRKEVDVRAGSYSSEKRFVTGGILRPMMRGRVALPEIEKLPINEDLTTDSKGKTIMAMLSSVDLFSRPFMAPPGTPSNVMAILREAFSKVAADPGLLEEAKKMEMDIKYVSAEECMKVLNYEFNQPESILNEFRKYIKF